MAAEEVAEEAVAITVVETWAHLPVAAKWVKAEPASPHAHRDSHCACRSPITDNNRANFR